jgi:hypothetical protein
MKIRSSTLAIIVIGLVSGVCFTLMAEFFKGRALLNTVFLNIGAGLVATAFISIALDLFWTKERIRNEQQEMKPFLDDVKNFASKLENLEGRLEAFKQLGLNYCTASRKDSLSRFYKYANDAIGNFPKSKIYDPDCAECLGTIKLVASSSRGLMGYLDREAHEIQKKWRTLINEHSKNFRILLTHPAYAHLRQPAEERSSGDIELEILKTAIYLHFVAGMGENELRLYRGSPTSFLVQVGRHILLNPYPYGKMAMDTLCLEFESENEGSYAAQFASMHFDHTWAFLQQPGKLVDGKRLVVGINSFDDILEAFSECTILGDPQTLRLTYQQVTELDVFISSTLQKLQNGFKINPPVGNPFTEFVSKRGLKC